MNSDTPAPPIGVIEALASGFDTVASRLVLILIPVALDVLLWMGPRLTAQPMFDRLYIQLWLPYVMSEPTEWQQFWKPIMTDPLSEAAHDENLQYLPSSGTLTLMTMRELLLSTRTAEGLPFDFAPPVWTIHDETELLGVVVGAFVIGTLLTTLQIAMVGQQIGEGNIRFWRLLWRLPAVWLRLIGFGAVVAMIAIILAMPLMILFTMFLIVSVSAARAVVWLGAFIMLWLGTFLFFSIHGIVMHNRGVLRSLWDSVRVVHWNLTATMMLILLVITLAFGLGMAWLQAPLSSWAVLLGIGGNAFITTGLIAATFVFFQDRYRYWQEVREMLLAGAEQQMYSRDRDSKGNGA